MKKRLFITVMFLCGCDHTHNRQASTEWNDENHAYKGYENCLNVPGGNPAACSSQTHVTVHQDSSGNKFFEYLGMYYLVSSMIGGRSYSYFGGYGYHPQLGSSYPQSTVINNTYVKNYNHLPPKRDEMLRRESSVRSRPSPAERRARIEKTLNQRKSDSNRPPTSSNPDSGARRAYRFSSPSSSSFSSSSPSRSYRSSGRR